MKKIPPHPSRPLAIALMGVGGVALGLSAVVQSAAAATFGVVGVLTGVFQWRMGIAAQNANAAAAAINRGDMEEARELVAFVRGRHRLTYVHRLLDSHESEIAWREGDLVTAKRHLETARARKDLIPYGTWRQLHIAHVDALYALTLAMLGDDAGAEAAIARVRNDERAAASSLARVELAHAALLARRGDLNALHRHLTRHHVLLSEGLESRGRALYRAFRRLAATRGTNAYRVPARTGTPKTGGSVAWISRVFPEGAELIDFEEGSEVAGKLAAPVVTTPAPAVPKAKRPQPWGRVLVLWALLIVLFLAIYMFLSESPGRPVPVPSIPYDGIAIGFVLFFVALVALAVRTARKKTRTLEEAQRALLCGEVERAGMLAASLVADRNGIIAANARLILANVRERNADFVGALQECDQALSLMTGTAAMGAADVLHPQLIATRAFLFGALGRDGDSDAELARLAAQFPAFPYAAGMVLRTRLVRAMRSGDHALAKELASARGDVSLGAYGELAAELVLARDAEDRDERLAALREDLAALPAADRWLQQLQSTTPSAIAEPTHKPATEA